MSGSAAAWPNGVSGRDPPWPWDDLCTPCRSAVSTPAIGMLAAMAFRSGSISYARFRVVGDAPATVNDALLATIAENVVRPPSVGAPPEVQVGWCAGQHVFDETFDHETVGFESSLCFGMRIDTNRVPAELKRAYRAMIEREHASSSPTGYLNRAEKQAVREEVDDRCKRELADGRHRSSKMLPIVWDLRRQLLFAPAFSDVKTSALSDLFFTTFDCRLEMLSAGALARDFADASSRISELSDIRPTAFTPPPRRAERDDDGDITRPTTPWSHGPEPSDFLGNEWLIWLWHRSAHDDGVETPAGYVQLAIDRVLDMDCAWDATGTQMLRADGPSRMPEAIKALQHGKWPRKAGLVVASGDEGWSLTVQADRFLLTGVKLPKPDEPAQTPHEDVQQRLDSMANLDEAMVGLYRAFLHERLDADRWKTTRRRISEWIKSGARVTPGATVAAPEAGEPPMIQVESKPSPAEAVEVSTESSGI